MILREPEHPLSIPAELFIHLMELPLPLLRYRHWLTPDIHMRAKFPYSLGRALGEDAVVGIVGLVLVDGERVLISGVERQAALFSLVVEDDGVLMTGFADVLNRLEELDEPGFWGVACGGHVGVEFGFELEVPFVVLEF